MAVTAREIISGSLKLCGVIDPLETLKPEDAADGLIMLNGMLELWSVDGLLLYAVTTLSASVSGVTATVGPTGTFVTTPRPIAIEQAYYRRAGIDYTLEPVGPQPYADISQKSLGVDYPNAYWYNPSEPNGTITLWPVPATAMTMYLNVQTELTQFADLDTAYTVPQGYKLGLMYALTEHMAPMYQKPLPAVVVKNLIGIKSMLRNRNLVVPQLDIGVQRVSRLGAFLAG